MAQDGNSDAVSPLSCTNRQLSAEDGTVSYWGPSLPCSDVGDTLSLKSVNVNRRIAQERRSFHGAVVQLCFVYENRHKPNLWKCLFHMNGRKSEKRGCKVGRGVVI